MRLGLAATAEPVLGALLRHAGVRRRADGVIGQQMTVDDCTLSTFKGPTFSVQAPRFLPNFARWSKSNPYEEDILGRAGVYYAGADGFVFNHEGLVVRNRMTLWSF